MANDRLYSQDFIFSNGEKVKKLIWESDLINNNIDKFPKKDGEVAEPYFEEIEEKHFPTILTKLSPDQIRSDRMKRSKKHFKEEIWPTMSKEDQGMFKNRSDLKPTK